MSDEQEEYVPPAGYYHAVKVYEKMLSQARLVRLPKEETDELDDLIDGDGPSNEGDMIVYEGALTALVTQQLHLSVPYYTSITRALKAMGCIKQLRRGGGQGLSQWQLLREPTIELYQQMDPDKASATRRNSSRAAVLEQRIADQEERIDQLEDFMQQIIDHFGTEEVKKDG